MSKKKQKERTEFIRLKECLLKAKKNQKFLIENLDVHQTTVSKWANNKDVPSLKTCYQITDLLGLEITDLLVVD